MQRNNLQFWSFLHNHTLIPVKSVYLNFIYVSVTDIKRLLKKSNLPPRAHKHRVDIPRVPEVKRISVV